MTTGMRSEHRQQTQAQWHQSQQNLVMPAKAGIQRHRTHIGAQHAHALR
jgi:hypothetical protein